MSAHLRRGLGRDYHFMSWGACGCRYCMGHTARYRRDKKRYLHRRARHHARHETARELARDTAPDDPADSADAR